MHISQLTEFTECHKRNQKEHADGLSRDRIPQQLLDLSSKRGKKFGKISETMEALKNGAFWDVTPCGSCKNRCFRGT
jgi:hypothetical protein